MSMREPCSALQTKGREWSCKNGFPVYSVCLGIDGRVPVCMDETLCGRIYKDTGGVPPVIARALDQKP